MKKFLSICLAIGLLMSLSLTTVFAYSTDVVYNRSLDRCIDVDGDDIEDGLITDQSPYILMVPETLTVNGAKQKVYIAGVVDKPVTVTVPKKIEMRDLSGNIISASLELTGDSLVLPVSLTDVGHSNTDIGARWETTPLAGNWSGSFMYLIA